MKILNIKFTQAKTLTYKNQNLFAQYPYSLINNRFQTELINFHQADIETEVYGVFAQGSLLGNNKKRIDLAYRTKQHHLEDIKVINKAISKYSIRKNKHKLAKELLHDTLKNTFIDNAIIGFSTISQVSSLLNG